MISRWFLAALLLICTQVFAQSYPWPMAPMNEQHRISATFDECRGDRDHFHNGTDIPLSPGGNVLNIEADQVLTIYHTGSNAYIRVGRFAYIHVDPDPALEVGDQMALGELVGHTNSQAHVHLKEGGGGSGSPVLNSLRDNALTPFEDTYGQHVYSIDFYLDGPGAHFSGNEAYGPVDIVVRAGDTTDTQSSIDMNNGVYKIGYRVFESDQITPVTNIQMSYTFDYLYSNSIINRVYAAGSNTSAYRYIVTNSESQDRYWDTTELPPGEYSVAIYTFDTKFNSDTTFFPVIVSEQDTEPPAPPQLSYVGQRGDSLAIEWVSNTESDLGGYRLYFSYDDVDWTQHKDENDLGADTTAYYIPGFSQGSAVYFYLQAVDNAPLPNVSQPSDVYGVSLSETPRLLLVDGLDRSDGMIEAPSHNFLMQYGAILDSVSVDFHSVSNEIVADENISMRDYSSVFWVLGDEDSVHQTFSETEQAVVQSYLESGGQLFIAGTDIATDLGTSGTTADENFLNDYLKIGPDTRIGEFSQVNGVSGSDFEDIAATINTNGFPVDSLDSFSLESGASVLLQFESGESVGTGYSGTFGESNAPGQIIVTSIPVMTLTPQSQIRTFVGNILLFFDEITILDNRTEETIPSEIRVSSAYPNPFNPEVHVSIEVPRALTLHWSVYNIAGQQVFNETRTFSDGRYTITWGGSHTASGLYLMQLHFTDTATGAKVYTQNNKMLLLK